MKKLLPIIFFLFPTLSFAQLTFSVGQNIAQSTNVGFLGFNPTLQLQRSITKSVNVDLRLNGFFDIGPEPTEIAFREHNYHNSLYSDLGVNFKIIDKATDWSIGTGVTYQVGVEKYVDQALYYGTELIEFGIQRNNLSRFGIFIKNTVGLGKIVSLNLTVYRFEYWGEYMSVGPSFKFN